MSVSYDSYVDIGEPQRMAPEGIITEDNIQELTEMATAPPQSVEPQEEQLEVPSNKMEAPIKDKVSRKKNRSEKQKATFEKARQKRLENIAKKKAERKAVEDQVAKDMDKQGSSSVVETPMTPSSKGGGYGGNAPTTNPELPSMEEQVKELEEIQNEVIKEQPILKKEEPLRYKSSRSGRGRKAKIVYVEPSSSSEESSEEEVVYVRQRKPQRKPRRKVVYQDDYGEEAEFRSVAPPRRTKPISFSDVFKYA